MPTPLLALRYKDGTTPQVRRYVGCNASTQGVSFGSLETGSGVQDLCEQRVIRFLGHRTFVACVNTKIFRSTDAGANWTEVLSDANLGTTAAKGGPVISYPGGVPTLSIFANNGGTWRIFYSTDGSSWSSSSGISLNNTTIPLSRLVQWRGIWYGVSGNGSGRRCFSWNPGTLTASQASFANSPNSGGTPQSLAVFNDRLFALNTSSASSGTLWLEELKGGTWTTVLTIATGVGNSSVDAKYALFVDGPHLVGVLFAVTGTAWRVFRWDANLNQTEISSTVDLASVVGSPSGTSRIVPLVDGNDPGSGEDPTIFLFYAANGTAGTALTLLRWNGVSSPVRYLGRGGNVQHALPLGVQPGGSCFWTSGQRHVERLGSTPVSGGMRWKFRLYSCPPRRIVRTEVGMTE